MALQAFQGMIVKLQALAIPGFVKNSASSFGAEDADSAEKMQLARQIHAWRCHRNFL